MKIVKNRQVIEDNWQVVSSGALEQGLPAGDIIIPFTYWLDNHQDVRLHEGAISVYLDPGDEIELLLPYLDSFSLVAFRFPEFKDGRSYSLARILRERFGYKGEVRAIGDVLRDQLFFMNRCGFDSFQIREDRDMLDAVKGLDDFSVTYQTAADGKLPVYKSVRN